MWWWFIVNGLSNCYWFVVVVVGFVILKISLEVI